MPASSQRHFRTNTEVPFSYIKDIDFPTMAKFSEHDVGLPGVDIAIKPVRSYVYGALAAHLLGYVGAPDETNKEEAKKFTFYQADVEGKSNIEKTMDEYLRGQTGGSLHAPKRQRADRWRAPGGSRRRQARTLYLTIDARIQMIAEEALRAVGRGAAVVVDPNNGRHPRHGFGALVRSEYFHPEHQGEGLGGAARKTKPIRSSTGRSARFRRVRPSSW